MYVRNRFSGSICGNFCDWFRNLKASACWQNAISQPFNVKSGFLQGSLLGTKFYNLTMDK